MNRSASELRACQRRQVGRMPVRFAAGEPSVRRGRCGHARRGRRALISTFFLLAQFFAVPSVAFSVSSPVARDCFDFGNSPSQVAAELQEQGWQQASDIERADLVTTALWIDGLNARFWTHGPERTLDFWATIETAPSVSDYILFGGDADEVILVSPDRTSGFIGGIRAFDRPAVNREVCIILESETVETLAVIAGREPRFVTETPVSKSTTYRFYNQRGTSFGALVVFSRSSFEQFGDRAPKYFAVSRRVSHVPRSKE